MRKSTRQSLSELAQWAPTIDEAALRGYIGGGTSDSSYYCGAVTENPYGYVTVDPYGSYGATEEPYYGYGSSTESPGYVEDYSIYCTSTPEYGGTTPEADGATPTPIMLDEVIVTPAPTSTTFSAEEYNALLDSGAWNGGMVEGMGYVAQPVTIFSGSGTYYTMPEYMRSQSMSGLNQLASWFLETVAPIFGYLGQEIREIHIDMQAELVENGYANSYLYVTQESNPVSKTMEYKVYDASSGNLLTSRSMNVFGF